MLKKIHPFMAFVLVFVLILQFSLEVRSSQITKQELEDQLESYSQREEEIVRLLSQYEGEIDLFLQLINQISARLGAIDQEILVLDQKVAELNAAILDKEEEIIETEIALQAAKQEEVDYREVMKARMRIMYEYGDTSYLSVLLDSENVNDFFTRLEYISKIFNYDQKMFDRLNEIQRGIQAQELKLEVDHLDLEALKFETEAKRFELEEYFVQKAIELDQLEHNQGALLVVMVALDQEQDKINAAIKDTIAALAELELQWHSGVLGWPSPGYSRITSPFGWRMHPIFGTERFHSGIDIATPYGTEIVAADRGVVVKSEYNSALGNFVVIYHGMKDGQSYSTVYAHHARNIVAKDDTVNRGDVIAYAGSTGWSTGPHLHFEVVRDGVQIDPMQFFGN